MNTQTTASKEVQQILTRSVTVDTLRQFQAKLIHYTLLQDDSYFDYELLKLALKRRHVAITNYLLKWGCRVRNPNKVKLEETPLHLAVRMNGGSGSWIDILKRILKNGASISDTNPNGETPLSAGFKRGQHNAVEIALTFITTANSKQMQYILSNLKCFDPTDSDNVVNFHVACFLNHRPAIQLFLTNKFDVNTPITKLDSEQILGSNLVHYAAEKADRCLFNLLLEYGGDLSIKNSSGQTPLHIAFYNRCTFIIEIAFASENGTKYINSVDKNNISHFFLCCSVNVPLTVKVFIDNGADVNSCVSLSSSVCPGYTPLHFAAKKHLKNVVQLLLESGADCNKVNKEGETPLHLICNNMFNSEIIEMLLDYNTCLTTVDLKGRTPLHAAFNFITSPISILDKLISKVPKEVNLIDNDGLSYFHIICTRNDVSRVHDFLKSGVTINSCVKSGKYSGYTALHFATLYNQKDVVEELLKNNAQVNVKTNKSLSTPLHFACDYSFHKIKFSEMNAYDDSSINLDFESNCKSHVDIIKLLLLHGADVDAQDSSGSTALLSTCVIDENYLFAKSLKPQLQEQINLRTEMIIDILLSNKANINACTRNHKSILHLMCRNNFPNMPHLVEYLISKGANIHAVDDEGLTPLHAAVNSCKRELVQIFIKHKADVNTKSKDALTPLQTALRKYFLEFAPSESKRYIICDLLEEGSDVNVKYRNGTPLLSEAIQRHNNFIVEKLLNYGADVNMENSSGDTTVSSLFEWNNEDEEYGSLLWTPHAPIFATIFTHVQKLLALDCFVSEEVMDCCTELYPQYQSLLFVNNELVNLSTVFDNCMEELKTMKLIKVDNYNSLYNFLQKDVHELSKHVRNGTLIEILEDQKINENFPLYSFLLKLNFKRGMQRRYLAKRAKSLLYHVIGLNLPDLCHDLILKYLTNEDIANLNAVAESNCKRKLNSDNSEDSQPPSKLQKTSSI